MLLRPTDHSRGVRLGLLMALLVGVLAALNVFAGNPGNMGICGACFLRDMAGSLGFMAKGPRYFRPEILGLLLGAFAITVLRGRYAARSGSHSIVRFFFGVWMGIGALVFLGCPFRMLQRLAGGDLLALSGLLGFLGGVQIGMWFERRGYSVGKTAVVHRALGLLPLLLVGGLAVLWYRRAGLLGPGPNEAGDPPHAPWFTALGIATIAGGLLSWTGFCAVSGARQLLRGPRWMLLGVGCLMLGYGVTLLIGGRSSFGVATPPGAHADHVASVLAMVLVGLSGVLAGGCPVRQIVMAGEGNGDAFITVVGIALGGVLAHNLGWAATPSTPTAAGGVSSAGYAAVITGIVASLLYASLAARTPKTVN